MENEENRGLIHKKAFEDQLVTFCQFSVGTLSHYSLSLSYCWRLRIFLQYSWRVWHTWIIGPRMQRKSRKAQEGIGINNYIRFSWMYRVSCMISSLVLLMHGLCMWFLDCHLSVAWRISWIESGLPSLVIFWMVTFDILLLF